MIIRDYIRSDRAVSPVIAIILMVAITVILAAVIATFVLSLGSSVSETAPQANFEFKFKNDASGPLPYDPYDQLNITHTGGDTIDSDSLVVQMSGSKFKFLDKPDSINNDGDGYTSSRTFTDLETSSDVSAGTTVRLYISSNDVSTSGIAQMDSTTVRVLYKPPNSDQSAVLAQWEGPEA